MFCERIELMLLMTKVKEMTPMIIPKIQMSLSVVVLAITRTYVLLYWDFPVAYSDDRLQNPVHGKKVFFKIVVVLDFSV